MLDQDLDLSAAVKLTRGTGCRALAGFTTFLGRQLAPNATPPMTHAAAALSYDQGADGFGAKTLIWHQISHTYKNNTGKHQDDFSPVMMS